jgi:hypothetical protein
MLFEAKIDVLFYTDAKLWSSYRNTGKNKKHRQNKLSLECRIRSLERWLTHRIEIAAVQISQVLPVIAQSLTNITKLILN